jgi:fructose-bisphosphate aldolase / 2-amino-3,7-dideoxy-D-threo-hept-6-ulosonate synthase
VSAGAALAADGRGLIVAIDHPLYSWPCPGLEDRAAVLRAVTGAGADAVICSYGTLRDMREAFGQAAPIMKLDVTTVSVDGGYPASEYVVAYEVEDALRLGAAARVAARADELGLAYVCEITAPAAIAAAARTAAELGAHVVKTTMPDPPEAMAEVAGCGVPVVLAGGDFDPDDTRLFDSVRRALAAGAAGVAHGRNVWGRPDPGAAVAALRAVVHPELAGG